MSRVWFTADLHLGHANIIRHCARPFADAAEMDAAIVGNWNAVVQPGDDVWVLGDFSFRSAAPADSYLARLRGRKHLVWGNHDNEASRKSPLWASSQPYAELKVAGRRLTLLHYGMRVWPGSNRGSLHLYGHSHGNLPGDRQCCDVGVDCWGFRPVGLDEITAHLETLPERRHVDHHQPEAAP